MYEEQSSARESGMNLNNYIDHTNLSPDASKDDIIKLCQEAEDNRFVAVCVNPLWVKTAVAELADTDVLVCSVIGFPTGAHLPEVKLREAKSALVDGAKELDTVIDIAGLKAFDKDAVRADIEPLASLAHKNDAILKVILETTLLTDEEIVRGSQWAEEFGADFVKTSTGTLKGKNSGASARVVELMHDSVGDDVKVKASGGIRDRWTAEEMIEAGADRIGTSSGVSIVE
jgi:deoxyribose-phosphate aldolase